MFDDRPRTLEGGMGYGISNYRYLDDSNRPEALNVRTLVNRLIERYPLDHREELEIRFRSDSNIEHDSAAFELVMHAMMEALGCQVEVHPELRNGSSKRPDFLVETPDGENFYLEAALVMDQSEEDMTSEARIEEALEKLSQFDSPDFLLELKYSGKPQTSPPARQWLSKVNTWLNSLSYEDLRRQFEVDEGFRSMPQKRFNHEDWIVDLRAYPRSPSQRGARRSTGFSATMPGVEWGSSSQAMAKTLKKKGRNYGRLDKPFLIAINVNDFILDRIDIMEALYGQEQFLQSIDHPRQEPRMERVPNGLWHGFGGRQYSRVSGVLVFPQLSLWNLANRTTHLYRNDVPSFDLPSLLDALPNARVTDGKMVWHEGPSVGELFSIPREWPEI